MPPQSSPSPSTSTTTAVPNATNTTTSNNWFGDKLSRFQNGHDRVKNVVHSYWMQNTILSPRGKFGKVVMSCVYFSLPVVAGYFVVTAVVDQSESTVLDRFGAIGNNTNHEPSSESSTEKIGAGGWGGGVNLATSDKQTHDVNKINLERFMKKQRRLKQKREREAAAAAAGTAAQ